MYKLRSKRNIFCNFFLIITLCSGSFWQPLEAAVTQYLIREKIPGSRLWSIIGILSLSRETGEVTASINTLCEHGPMTIVMTYAWDSMETITDITESLSITLPEHKVIPSSSPPCARLPLDGVFNNIIKFPKACFYLDSRSQTIEMTGFSGKTSVSLAESKLGVIAIQQSFSQWVTKSLAGECNVSIYDPVEDFSELSSITFTKAKPHNTATFIDFRISYNTKKKLHGKNALYKISNDSMLIETQNGPTPRIYQMKTGTLTHILQLTNLLLLLPGDSTNGYDPLLRGTELLATIFSATELEAELDSLDLEVHTESQVITNSHGAEAQISSQTNHLKQPSDSVVFTHISPPFDERTPPASYSQAARSTPETKSHDIPTFKESDMWPFEGNHPVEAEDYIHSMLNQYEIEKDSHFNEAERLICGLRHFYHYSQEDGSKLLDRIWHARKKQSLDTLNTALFLTHWPYSYLDLPFTAEEYTRIYCKNSAHLNTQALTTNIIDGIQCLYPRIPSISLIAEWVGKYHLPIVLHNGKNRVYRSHLKAFSNQRQGCSSHP